MADANALTYLNLQDAVLGRRFNPNTQRANAKRWLATAYADVWTAADWTFKRVSRADLALTDADPTPVMPTDFADAIALYDDSGYELQRLSEEVFEHRYANVLVQSQTGTPEAFMVVGRQITVAPLPSATTFTLSYYRRIAHKDTNGAIVEGYMTSETDYPLWDDHHSVLIPRAMALGLMEINDPTWTPLMDEYQRQLSRMIEDDEQTRPALQWSSINWYA